MFIFYLTGKTIVKRYPVLAMEGSSAYSFFNKKLSGRMRNVRSRRKSKMNTLASCLPPAKKLKLINSASASLQTTNSNLISAESNLSMEDEDIHPEDLIQKLKNEKTKVKPDISSVKLWQKKTFEHRRSWIQTKPSTDLTLSSVLKEYPWLHDPDIFQLELELLDNNADEFHKNFVDLVKQINDLLKTDYLIKNEMAQLELIKIAEERVQKGRNKKKGSPILVVDSVGIISSSNNLFHL